MALTLYHDLHTPDYGVPRDVDSPWLRGAIWVPLDHMILLQAYCVTVLARRGEEGEGGG